MCLVVCSCLYLQPLTSETCKTLALRRRCNLMNTDIRYLTSQLTSKQGAEVNDQKSLFDISLVTCSESTFLCGIQIILIVLLISQTERIQMFNFSTCVAYFTILTLNLDTTYK